MVHALSSFSFFFFCFGGCGEKTWVLSVSRRPAQQKCVARKGINQEAWCRTRRPTAPEDPSAPADSCIAEEVVHSEGMSSSYIVTAHVP